MTNHAKVDRREFKPELPKIIETFQSELSERCHELITILENLLKLNPYLRYTAHECIRKKIFDPYRDTRKEKVLSEMKRKK